MKISIILSSYNGSKYIIPQMASLMRQTRKADEVILIDDASTDETVNIIKKFVDENNLSETWKLVTNTDNKGWTYNFYYGFKMATGDLVFPCDQDDIWCTDKLQNMTQIMEENPNILVLAGLPHKFEDGTENQIDSHKQLICSKSVTKVGFDHNFVKRAPGCVEAIRKSLIDKALKYWSPSLPHDGFSAYFGNLLDGYYYYDDVVIEWRQHRGSASRPAKRSRSVRMTELLREQKMFAVIYQYAMQEHLSDEKLKIIKAAVCWNELRLSLVKEHKILSVFPLLRYINLYNPRKRIITDIMYCCVLPKIINSREK